MSAPNPNIKAWGQPFRFEGSGSKAVLLIHGFTGSTHQLRPLGERMAIEKGWTTLGIRLPGHGTTVEDLVGKKWTDWYKTSSLALEELNQNHKTIIVLGFSLGGALAFYLAAKKKESVSGVVGLCPALRLRGIGQHFVPLLKYFKAFHNKGEPDPNDPWRGYHVVPLDAMHEGLKFQKIVRQNLPTIHQPILVVQARNDKRVPSAVGKEIAKRVSSDNIEQFWAENSDHMIMYGPDAPKVTGKIMDFIQAL